MMLLVKRGTSLQKRVQVITTIRLDLLQGQ